MVACRLALACLAVSLSGSVIVPAAFAQTDMNAMLRNSAANQLGILEYCQSQGHTDGTAVAAQRTVMSRLPAGGPTDAAEALGKQGTLLGANNNNYPMSAMASKGNTTEAALCTQMAGNVKQAVANNPAMSMPAAPGGMPAMPAMPGGMPQMPAGMPAMPSGMPAAPSTPPG